MHRIFVTFGAPWPVLYQSDCTSLELTKSLGDIRCEGFSHTAYCIIKTNFNDNTFPWTLEQSERLS